MVKNVLEHPLIKLRRDSVQKTEELFDSLGYKKNNFCVMPFVNLILEPNGSVGLCRHKGTEFSMGNINEQSIDEIWNGEKVREWRREFLDKGPKICSTEIRDQQCNLCPQLNLMLPKANIEEVVSSPPLRLTANLNGQCNLECQMCIVWQLPNGLYNEENFWKPGREGLFVNLEEIDMLSGEPLIQADTYKLIDEVSSVNPDCLWSITTNAHWNLNKKITDALDKIKIKNLIISIDSLDEEIYPIIRKKGNLKQVLKTVESLLDYEKNRVTRGLSDLSMNLNFLVQHENWHEVKTIIDYCLERNIHPFVTMCYEPLAHSPLSLALEKRKEILDYYIENLTWDYLTLVRRITVPLLDSLPAHDKAFYLSAFKDIKEVFEKN